MRLIVSDCVEGGGKGGDEKKGKSIFSSMPRIFAFSTSSLTIILHQQLNTISTAQRLYKAPSV